MRISGLVKCTINYWLNTIWSFPSSIAFFVYSIMNPPYTGSLPETPIILAFLVLYPTSLLTTSSSSKNHFSLRNYSAIIPGGSGKTVDLSTHLLIVKLGIQTKLFNEYSIVPGHSNWSEKNN